MTGVAVPAEVTAALAVIAKLPNLELCIRCTDCGWNAALDGVPPASHKCGVVSQDTQEALPSPEANRGIQSVESAELDNGDVQCLGVTNEGRRCGMRASYKAVVTAQPLRVGRKYCANHLSQDGMAGTDAIQCLGKRADGTRCQLRSTLPFDETQSLRDGKKFCQHHASQTPNQPPRSPSNGPLNSSTATSGRPMSSSLHTGLEPFAAPGPNDDVQCQATTKEGRRCGIRASHTSFAEAQPLREGKVFCSRHAGQHPARPASWTQRSSISQDREISEDDPPRMSGTVSPGGGGGGLSTGAIIPDCRYPSHAVTDVQCQGSTKEGRRCGVRSSYTSFDEAQPLREGKVFCSRHAIQDSSATAAKAACLSPSGGSRRSSMQQAPMDIQCQGTTKEGRRCGVRSTFAFDEAAPLREGKTFCARHATHVSAGGTPPSPGRGSLDATNAGGTGTPRSGGYRPPSSGGTQAMSGGSVGGSTGGSVGGDVQCQGRTEEGRRCGVRSSFNFDKALPLREGKQYCTQHASQGGSALPEIGGVRPGGVREGSRRGTRSSVSFEVKF